MGVKLRALLLVLIAGLAPGAARAANNADGAEAFVNGMVTAALKTLRDPAMTEAERERRLGQLLVQDFDTARIARYVLGRYWMVASPGERRDFARLFRDWAVRSYAARMVQYSNETVKVTGARPESDTDAVVTSEITHPAGPATRVGWRVSHRTGAYRIIDVDVEGVSMALTERDEIAATIQRSGGTVAALNRTLAGKLHDEIATAQPAHP
ncbi:MAG TPA: ABC transporter substrate-binding protein [Stellaceae bacterium]|nr:ABC transporter substrate-binding protein [Stellaceae bacterium]